MLCILFDLIYSLDIIIVNQCKLLYSKLLQTLLEVCIKTHDSESRGQEEAQQRDH